MVSALVISPNDHRSICWGDASDIFIALNWFLAEGAGFCRGVNAISDNPFTELS